MGRGREGGGGDLIWCVCVCAYQIDSWLEQLPGKFEDPGKQDRYIYSRISPHASRSCDHGMRSCDHVIMA